MNKTTTPLLFSLLISTAAYTQNVGIGTSAPQDMLHINGITRTSGLRIIANNALETGFGVAGKETSAGKIGYALFTPNTLDIVGGGTAGHLRRIKFWAEGGSQFEGPMNITGFTKLGTNSHPLKTLTFTVPVEKQTNSVGGSWGTAVVRDVPVSIANIISHTGIASYRSSLGVYYSYPMFGDGQGGETGKAGYYMAGSLPNLFNVLVRFADCDLCDVGATFTLHLVYTDVPVF